MENAKFKARRRKGHWFLQTPDRQLLAQFERALRPGGFVVIGWNDTEERRPQPLSEMLETHGFESFALPGIGAASTATGTAYRRTYHFFRKAR